jgi:hypothetical protein
MRRTIVVIGVALAALVLVLQASASVGWASHGTGQARLQKSGPITIQSWLYLTPDKNGLSGTVTACFKLQGAFRDQGGAPNWTNSTYTDTAATPPSHKCGAWYPVGGYVFVPGVKTTDDTVYAVHTITGKHGDLFITFSGTYDLVKTFQGSGTWVITGGTSAYKGAHGEGTWMADASTFPYVRHTETGVLSTR